MKLEQFSIQGNFSPLTEGGLKSLSRFSLLVQVAWLFKADIPWPVASLLLIALVLATLHYLPMIFRLSSTAIASLFENILIVRLNWQIFRQKWRRVDDLKPNI